MYVSDPFPSPQTSYESKSLSLLPSCTSRRECAPGADLCSRVYKYNRCNADAPQYFRNDATRCRSTLCKLSQNSVRGSPHVPRVRNFELGQAPHVRPRHCSCHRLDLSYVRRLAVCTQRPMSPVWHGATRRAAGQRRQRPAGRSARRCARRGLELSEVLRLAVCAQHSLSQVRHGATRRTAGQGRQWAAGRGARHGLVLQQVRRSPVWLQPQLSEVLCAEARLAPGTWLASSHYARHGLDCRQADGRCAGAAGSEA